MSLSQEQKQALQTLFGENCRFDLPLAPFTSIRIGGPADAMIWPEQEEQLVQTIVWAQEQRLDYFILGKGSNTLVLDGGFRGLVIQLGKGFRRFGKWKENGQSVWIEAEGGVPTQQLVRFAALEGLSGLECLAGVPGTLGGNIVMNAGTYLGEVGPSVEAVKVVTREGKTKTLEREKLKFDYRRSNLPPSAAVVWALLKLQRGDKEKIETKIREVFEKRGLAQPIEYPNLGSVFKNPGKKKAWELIEEAGCKGVRVGQARVSEQHGNFIVNEGKARAKDVLILIRMIKERVKQTTGIMLETEVKTIGEEG